MSASSFSIRLEPNELKYLLFGKKVCPECGGTLIKSRESEIRTGKELNDENNHSAHGYFPMDNEDVRCYTWYFTCSACGARFPLSKLAE